MCSIEKVGLFIPARLNSSRLNQKMLYPIHQKPLLEHVFDTCLKSSLISRDNIVIATGDDKIASVANQFGAHVIRTPDHFQSGTDRVFYASQQTSYDIILNCQGDLAVFDPAVIDDLAHLMTNNPSIQMATLAIHSHDQLELHNPNTVKVVLNKDSEALYFSRHPLAINEKKEFLKHIGIYAYRKDTLVTLCNLPPSPLERLESLEQLRALQNNIPIKVLRSHSIALSVDTIEDVFKVESCFNQRILSNVSIKRSNKEQASIEE